MKKSISCLLAVLLALACLTPAAFAADGYTKSHSVTLESVSATRADLVDLTEENLKDAIADPSAYLTNGFYVPDGETAVIALRARSGYTFDLTSRVKVYPSTINTDIITGKEYENSAYGTILNMTVLCDDEGQPIDEFGNKLDEKEVDKQGFDRWEGADKKNLIYIGTFANTSEDIVVKVYNVDMDSLGDIWDFLLSMFKFFENIIRWFFALTPFKQ